MSETDNEKKTVEILHRINHLKRKAGGDPHNDKEGRISENAIKEADRQIERFCGNCPKVVRESLDTLITCWQELKAVENTEKKKSLAQDIFTKAHQIKDVGSMCGYLLISDFGESLRDYILETKLDQNAHEKIIQAHIDVMMIAYRDNIKDDGGPVAAELRSLLQKAIEKYQ